MSQVVDIKGRVLNRDDKVAFVHNNATHVGKLDYNLKPYNEQMFDDDLMFNNVEFLNFIEPKASFEEIREKIEELTLYLK